jgi:hypothetical protein
MGDEQKPGLSWIERRAETRPSAAGAATLLMRRVLDLLAGP